MKTSLHYIGFSSLFTLALTMAACGGSDDQSGGETNTATGGSIFATGGSGEVTGGSGGTADTGGSGGAATGGAATGGTAPGGTGGTESVVFESNPPGATLDLIAGAGAENLVILSSSIQQSETGYVEWFAEV